MKFVPPSFPNGRVIFCDDIRQEVGNKPSFMGVYTSSMVFPASVTFPITLARLGIAIFWNEPIDGYSEELTFSASFLQSDAKSEEDGELLIESKRNLKDGFEKLAIPSFAIDADQKPYTCRQTLELLMISPFVIPRLGKVRVRVHRTSDVRIAGVLRIQVESEKPTQPSEP